MHDRRGFLRALAAAAVSPALPSCAQGTARFTANPFSLGVASGYPHPGGMVLWTRLTGLEDPVAVPVRWEVAADEPMKTLVASGDFASLGTGAPEVLPSR
jgi:alkaline phosphatase D